MAGLLDIEHVSKSFTGHTALSDVSLSVPQGSVYGLLGPNGAGKTTLIRIINRITAPDSGRVLFDSHPLSPADVAQIGYLPEERGLYKKMKVGEQALYFARLKDLSKADATVRLRKWFEKFGIEEWWGRKIEELSKGMAQKVQFIVTVVHGPRLLIFDEPFSGFDPINAEMLKEQMLSLRQSGATIIFSTHNMASVEEVCDHITLINRSRNILSGPIEQVRRSFGTDSYTVTFSGSTNDLTQRLQGKCTILESSDGSLRFSPFEKNGLRDIVALINEQVRIRSLRENVPSMNDIFIRAVQSANAVKS